MAENVILWLVAVVSVQLAKAMLALPYAGDVAVGVAAVTAIWVLGPYWRPT